MLAVSTVMAFVLGGSAWLLRLTVSERMQTAASAIGVIAIIASACVAGGTPPGILSVLLSGPVIVTIAVLPLVIAAFPGFPVVVGLVGSALVGVAVLLGLCGTLPVWYRSHWPWTVTMGVIAALIWCGSGYLLAQWTAGMLIPATG